MEVLHYDIDESLLFGAECELSGTKGLLLLAVGEFFGVEVGAEAD